MNKRGQSIIEYSLIAVLVILGIVIMGPYVLRSVGAHFKLWDEGVQDSFTENITQAPVNDVPYISTNCKCTNSPGSCGSAQAGTQCGANQRVINHSCNPQLCDGAPASSCINDPACCTAWVNVGCGTIPIGETPPSNNCNYGQEIKAQQCGTNNTVQCTPNSNCDAQCLGVLSPGGLYCATYSTVMPTNLNQNYGITYVTTCPSSPTCQVYCEPGYLLSSTGTTCLRTFIVAPASGPCPVSCTCNTNGHTETYTCNFQICASSNITALVAADPTGQDITSPIAIPTGPGEDGCQNPNSSGVDEGEPGTTCQITTT